MCTCKTVAPFIILQNPQLDIPHFSPHFHNRHLHRKVLSVSQPGKFFSLSLQHSAKRAKRTSQNVRLCLNTTTKKTKGETSESFNQHDSGGSPARAHTPYGISRAGPASLNPIMRFFFSFSFSLAVLAPSAAKRKLETYIVSIWRVYIIFPFT